MHRLKKYAFLTLAAFSIALAIFFTFSLDDASKSSKQSQNDEKLHQSYFTQKDFYETSFATTKDTSASDQKVYGTIVNHHLLAPQLIIQALSKAQNQNPEVVILLSPNHFSEGRGQIISSIQDWNTPYGILKSHRNLTQKLAEKGSVNIDEVPFKKEHGISGIVGFIKKIWPDTKIVPIIIKDRAAPDQIEAFTEELQQILPDNTLIVGSFDFSHGQTSSQSDLNDKRSLEIIQSLDSSKVTEVHIDSKPGLKLMLDLMKSYDATQFHLLSNTNSAKILNKENVADVTSYIVGYFTQGYK